MSREFVHDPVMADEVVGYLDGAPAGTVIDATVGGGGHAVLLLEHRSDRRLVGIDRDPVALRAATERLRPFGDRAELRRARFDELGDLATELAERGKHVAGVLFDLGVSSPQLDDAERGFSFHHDGPLDMRMDADAPVTAADVVNGTDFDEFVRLLVDSGEDRFARRIVSAIVAARPIETTARLAEVVAAAVPAAARRRGHPARRVFQAVRIAVNEELSQLPVAIDAAIDALSPGGRLVVLAYHSGEDRIVKERLRYAATGGCVCPPGLPCVCGATPTLHLLRRGAVKPTAAEIARNPRSESARLRVAERLAVTSERQ